MKSRRLAGSLTAIAALSASIFAYTTHPVRSSDHQDSPTVVARPGADITDVYMFPSPTNSKAVDLVMNVIPLIPAGMASDYSFDPGVLYQFKVAHGPVGSTNPEDSVLQLLPHGTGPNQTLSVYGMTSPPPLVGTKSVLGNPLGTIPFNRPGGTALAGGLKAFAGPRADPFFFDLFQFTKILPDRDYSEERSGNQLGVPRPSFNGYPSGSTSGTRGSGYFCNTAPATNTFTEVNGGFNVLSIVVEVPRSLFVRNSSSIVHLWETASTATSAKYNNEVVYEQIELHARPAEKELFEVFNSHAITNASNPYNDPVQKSSIQTFMTQVAGRSSAIKSVVTSVLYPNELIADVSQQGPGAYLGVETGGATGGKFGGRTLTDDVMTMSLGVVFGNTVPKLGLAPDDGKENNCLTSDHLYSGFGGRQTQGTFPFLTTPH